MTRGKAAALTSAAASTLVKADRPQLLEALETYRSYRNEWLRRQIIDNQRIDLLATEVLGYSVQPFHFALQRFQFLHPQSLQLVFRGAGKTTTCTVTKIVHLLASNRNLRILIASKTKRNAETFLKEVKAHLETNKKLIELFGPFYDPYKVVKWDNTEIEVLGRTQITKEASVTCVGVDSAVVSRHYDVIICDDLVDEENARTKAMREKTRVWYYQTLDPTLEPPDPTVPYRGQRHMLGTRYHYDDLYGHLIENELKTHHQIIPALSEDGESPWPAKYPPEWFLEKKSNAGLIIFNAQYQCDCEAMKGEVFRYDDCQQLRADEWPAESTLKIFMGVDLVIKESETADQFAIVVIGVEGKIGSGNEKYYVLDYYAGHLRFSEQTGKIIKMYKEWKPISCLVEANAYQLAQVQELKRIEPDMRVRPHITDKDKMTRAWKLSPLFESGRMFFRKDVQGPLIDQLVLFPNHRYKDLFDALDLAVMAAKRRKKSKPDRQEPRLI